MGRRSECSLARLSIPGSWPVFVIVSLIKSQFEYFVSFLQSFYSSGKISTQGGALGYNISAIQAEKIFHFITEYTLHGHKLYFSIVPMGLMDSFISDPPMNWRANFNHPIRDELIVPQRLIAGKQELHDRSPIGTTEK